MMPDRPVPARPGRSRASIAAVLLLTLAAACQDVNVVSHTYATLDEAVADGAVAGGYLPQGLPASTYDLREAHDPDSDRRWALFSFPPAEGEAVRALLQPDLTDLTGAIVDVPGRIEWWPLLLRERLDPSAIQATGLETYRTRDDASLMAVNWRQGRAYVWKAP
jgi:hypothetical protein